MVVGFLPDISFRFPCFSSKCGFLGVFGCEIRKKAPAISDYRGGNHFTKKCTPTPKNQQKQASQPIAKRWLPVWLSVAQKKGQLPAPQSSKPVAGLGSAK
jgi:hypothetical protein